MGWWKLEAAADAAHLSYIGGDRIPEGDLSFYSPPRAAIVWDAWGRATRIDFDENGTPKPPPPKEKRKTP